MTRIGCVVQPTARTTLDALASIVRNDHIVEIDIAVAYITSSGVNDFLRRVTDAIGNAWGGVQKRWITSFDYCRTEPVALDALLSMPNSSVRIHDAQFCLSHDCVPKVPFHPKAFLMRSNQRDYALAGSGNLSRSGLSRGIEAGLSLEISRVAPVEPTALASVQALQNWFAVTWNSAAPLNAALLSSYGDIFEDKENLKTPAPTEDDVASTDVGGGALSSKDLQKLRVCRHLWIEAGKITKNRGPTLPGSQLMMKRLSRVFFGFSPTGVPENTPIGTVDIGFNDGPLAQYSLTYSDNKMDKLNLPIPGVSGPSAYDNQYLLFRREMPGRFQLTVGKKSAKRIWQRRSEAIGGAFRMASGREWGVF
jgi:HKD family nuclease